jgi:hypothetical protein
MSVETRHQFRDEWAERRRQALLEDRLEMREYQKLLRPSINEAEFISRLNKRLGE